MARRACRCVCNSPERGRNDPAGQPPDARLKLNSLFQHILGAAFGELPPQVQRIHDARPRKVYTGRCAVERGDGLLVRLMARLARLPATGTQIPVTVTIEGGAGRESWRRRFGSHAMDSVLWQRAGLLHERLGAVTLRFVLLATEGEIQWQLRGARLLVLPLPRAWFQRCTAREFIEDQRYGFEVNVELRGIGLLVRYRGWMTEHESGHA